MQEGIQNQIQTRIRNWFMRKTTASAVRRVGELPFAIGSDIGNVRGENQDRVAVLKVPYDLNQSFVVVALCDGMGGMIEGSACASEAITSFFISCIYQQDIPPTTRVLLAAQEANRAVYSKYQGRGGATLSAILFDSRGGMTGVNVGDSRIYSYRENKLEQLTVDDTMAGVLNKEDDDSNRWNELLQFIGIGDGLEPHVVEMSASQEMMVLTSDGVHYIDKSVLQTVIQNAKEPALAVKRMIEVAKWCGGRDNASIAIASPLVVQQQLFDDAGIIQIWDPFGELQVIVPEVEADKEIAATPIMSPPPDFRADPLKKRNAKTKKKAKPYKRKEAGVVARQNKKDNVEINRPLFYINSDAEKPTHD